MYLQEICPEISGYWLEACNYRAEPPGIRELGLGAGRLVEV